MMSRPISELISHLEALDVQIYIENEHAVSSDGVRLRCNAPEGALTPELREELKTCKAELIAYLSGKKGRKRKEEGPEQEPKGQKAEANAQKVLADDTQGCTPNPQHPSTNAQASSFNHFSTSCASHVRTSNPQPLSFAQQRLWFLYQLAPDNPFYNIPAAIRLTGNLDQEALKRSFQEIVQRHETLRTRFTTIDGQPVQIIEPTAQIDWSLVNLQTVEIHDRDRICQQLAMTEAQRPFNLTTDSLLRLTLLQLGATECILLLTMHHIIADGWSLGVLIQELASCYTAFVEGNTPSLPALPIQYTEFAEGQRHELRDVLEQQLSYWRKQLQNLTTLELPSDRPRPTVQTYRGNTYPFHLPKALTEALIALSQQSGASLFMTLLAAFQTLLHRYTGQNDIAIGSPIANRHRSEFEGMIGFFVNSLVLRSQLSGDLTFRELLEQVRQVALEAYEHQDLPFEKLVEELDPDRDPSRNPLFQVAFALQNAPMQPFELPELTLEPAPLESGSTRFDLEVHLWEPAHGLRSVWRSQEGLSGFIAYSTDLFDRDRISRLIGHFQTLLEGIVANPNACLSELPLLTQAELQQLLFEWNRACLTLPPQGMNDPKVPRLQNLEVASDWCFHHLFEAHVQTHPDAIAIVAEQGSLTYLELNQRADQLAQTLQQLGAQPSQLIGLCVDRSADMVVGILGILKAGCAYVPLDPAYPSDRLQFMLTDTQVAILLTHSWLVPSLPTAPAHILVLDQLHPAQFEFPWQSQKIVTTPDHLAYVIYTSGSTGTPKAVLLTHRGLCNVVRAQQQVFHVSRNHRILQFSSLSFDASIFEIALALGAGGSLFIPPKAAQLPGMALVQFLQSHAITHALLTPAVLTVLPQAELPDLEVLITGGEACSNQEVDRWAANRHFFNAYGPTETTIWATVAILSPGDNSRNIGRPILNTQVYILDDSLNPVPVGVSGELYIGGTGLAQGYLNRPDLTRERFIDWEVPILDLQSHEKSQPKSAIQHPKSLRLYKTGDRGLYRADGTIEFLGRTDHQIKIRGFRVELGEIEASLQRHPAVREAVVVPNGETADEMRLVGYFSLDYDYFRSQLSTLQNQHIQHWQTLYNQTYQPTIAKTRSPISQFNITGWNSSYTGEPIPLEEMQEWVSDRVQQIRALQPKRVLEIGCGLGLLLFQIAPYCQQYVATDFSATSLESIQNQLHTLNLTHVELLNCMAHEFDEMSSATFDVIILNSVIQYFPSQDYLLQVLSKALQKISPGGVLFVGDVRSFALLTAFHSWIKFNQAEANTERLQLRQQVERSQFEEPELTVDPAFFNQLRDRFPQIEQVQIRLSRGRYQNEMTQFRYNVLLHTKQQTFDQGLTAQSSFGSGIPISTNQANYHCDWRTNPITTNYIRDYLAETEPDICLITNITNSRTFAAVKTADWLRNHEAPKTVGRMRDILHNLAEPAISPQDWWDLETVLPYNVEITWSAQGATGNYDVQLIRRGISTKIQSLFAEQSEQPPCCAVTNEPLQSNFARQLIPQLRQYLKQTLPAFMVPTGLIPLEILPLSINGKVDRRVLSSLNETLGLMTSSGSMPLTTTPLTTTPLTTTPLTTIEETLITIWKELLRLQQVSIHDNFFEAGGHSLLATQMTSRIRDVFELELPLKSVFESPTIAQLAPILETLQNATSTASAPPLVRLERSAYRRQKLALSRSPLDIQPPTSNLRPHAETIQPSPSTIPNGSTHAGRSPLVPLTLGNRQQSFFCVHPMFGVVFPYLELAHHLGGDRSFYGLQPLGLDGKSPPLKRIEAIAAYYIDAIQTLQPQGPYFLGGWSFGGLVAYEMAQQLIQKGQTIGLVAIFDTPAPAQKLSFSQSLRFLLGTALWSTLPFLLDYGALASHRLKASNSWFSRRQWSAIARLLPEDARLPLLDEATVRTLLPIVYANSEATYRYIPQPYPQRLTLFKAAEQPDSLRHQPTLGWSTLVSDIQLHHVPGNHLSLLKQPHVQILAQQLQQLL